MKEHISIIGAGIGGLTTALALQKQGYQYTIFEDTPKIQPVGAGIVLANNAMQIYERLGLRKAIENAGCKISNISIRDEQLNTLSSVNLNKYESKYGVFNVAIHRADLHKILAEAIGFENIKLSKKLSKIEEKNGFQLNFEDGSIVHTNTLIGADGLKSIVRNQLFKIGQLRDSNQRCWRGVCDLDWASKFNDEAFEVWGKGKRFGFVKISQTKIYWFAVINEALIQNKNITELFKEFHPDIVKIISNTPSENILFSPIIDLQPIHQWQKGNVCLLGDAAHATTPNLGQGACQAIEDAYIIGNLLGQGKSIEDAFALYEKTRIDKAHFIVNTSWKFGKIAHFENNLARWIRNKLIKLTPPSINEKQLEKIFDIEYLDKLK